MLIFLWSLILIICLAALSKSAGYLVKYSTKLGLALGMSSFVIGATIVAIGTSAPELFSSMIAVLSAGVTEFVADNVIGSNIANAMLILGIGAIYAKTLKVETSLIDIDLPFFFASMVLFVYFVWDGNITFWEGVLLLLFFLIFIIYSVKAGREPEIKKEDKEELKNLKGQYIGYKIFRLKKKYVIYFKYVFYIILSVAVLSLSAKYLVTSILMLSEMIGIGSSTLTITIVALGTSLPEIVTSIAAIKLGNHAIAIGNVFGSNTFNLTLIAGLPALFTTLRINEFTLIMALPFLVIATFMVIFTTFDNKVRFWEGAAMLFLYLVFLLKIMRLV